MTEPRHLEADAPREPLLTRASVVTIIGVLAALLVKVGGGQVSAWLDQNADLIAGLILAAAPLVAAWLARSHVTPVAAPKDNAGHPLIPAAPVSE